MPVNSSTVDLKVHLVNTVLIMTFKAFITPFQFTCLQVSNVEQGPEPQEPQLSALAKPIPVSDSDLDPDPT